MKEKQTQCPLWEMCNDHWKYYTNMKCEFIEMIEKGEVSKGAEKFIKRVVNEYTASPGNRFS